ncbi:flagellar basal body-associated protein FliL [Afipia carboxidovorans OM5]|uniref:Flagellar protein FliL n=2 Tax=Afipia carboxidovorans TaxID=40137 RepID=F8BTT1_AFIC5|nr:flagellar basal body-associated protein FliL [Afipia carboxidovorans OM4]AEI07285.1 flagellar basal body-associated protein FliL [Afipia carboxidovorans OM5]BEV44748.1 flagellar basal body-associated protein FliL [Afipia carboxidovorans]
MRRRPSFRVFSQFGTAGLIRTGRAMADEDQVEESAAEVAVEAAPSSRRKIFMIAGAVVLALMVGALGWFVFLRSHDETQHADAAAAKVVPPVFLDVPDILVNLASNPGERIQYLKVKAVLELKEAPLVDKVKPSMPRVTDLFQTYLRELRANDLNGSVGLFRMKEELTKRVNVAIAPERVNAVLFKEVVIQ